MHANFTKNKVISKMKYVIQYISLATLPYPAERPGESFNTQYPGLRVVEVIHWAYVVAQADIFNHCAVIALRCWPKQSTWRAVKNRTEKETNAE